MPYGITQCYLPPGSGDIPAFNPAEAGTRFSDPGGMQGWVNLGGGYNSQDSLSAKDLSEINNQAVSWPGGEPLTSSRESAVLTTRVTPHQICK